MVSKSKLNAVIEKVLRDIFDDIDIETITVEPDIDEDGDNILRVRVIFDGENKQLDTHKTSSLLRYMRPKIADIGENAFPVVSFIAKSEIRKPKPEAA
ncbi:MAG TPA: hypothetical protein ENI69_00795 [Rhodospirillales bacterium]|nr:hypothetical protein [Rhodospirillales bacterium]